MSFESMFALQRRKENPIAPSRESAGAAWDLLCLCTVAWRLGDAGDSHARTALTRAGCAYIDALAAGAVDGADAIATGRSAAMDVITAEIPWLNARFARESKVIVDAVAAIPEVTIEDMARLVTIIEKWNHIKRHHLMRSAKARDCANMSPILRNAFSRISALQGAWTTKELIHASRQAMDDDFLEQRIKIERLHGGKIRIALSDEARADILRILDTVEELWGRIAGDIIRNRGFDENGKEIRLNIDQELQHWTERALEMWDRNSRLMAKDDTYRSKISVISNLVSYIESKGGSRAAETLQQDLTTFLLSNAKLEQGWVVQPIQVVRGEWIAALCCTVEQQLMHQGYTDFSEAWPELERRLGLAVERALLTRPEKITVLESLKKHRDANGLFDYSISRPLTVLEQDEQGDETSGRYPFNGGLAYFSVEGDSESVHGVTPCMGQLSVWNDKREFVGAIRGYWMRGSSSTPWGRFSGSTYCYIADACDDTYTQLASALVEQLGGAPNRPTVILTSIERSPKSQKGLGSLMVGEFTRQLRMRHKYIAYAAIHIAPAQFDWEDGEEPPALLMAERFEAAQKLKSWADGPATDALNEEGVRMIGTISTDRPTSEGAVSIIGEMLLKQDGKFLNH